MEENEICIGHSSLYEWYAHISLKPKELGRSTNNLLNGKAEPIEKLKLAQSLFVKRMSERLNTFSLGKVDGDEHAEFGKKFINPWSPFTVEELLKKIQPQITKYDVYHLSKKAYSGKVALSSLKKYSRNKIIEIGGRKYQIKGCAGQGGFAQVSKAHVDRNPDDVVALKDAINSYVVTGKFMEEVLCIYYTMEMLYMLETLHSVGIIHGDFKPDNLLIRYSK
ncbi:mitotic checkpoint serine/threonine-protein kinase BUB1-like isoform X2 [Hibiscus syriacus]|uniref:mitotic checkpoint serine/threonine-protein kinase BUB1-like isoform X2 n=1 Tax=Hibiscus syriacus TaxID=106335 RepID=UPI001924EF6A|nr:mitotic checkpoint serine/threonine-protein kinase BUB1-like isoform X2 [Hibiscus syriacus]